MQHESDIAQQRFLVINFKKPKEGGQRAVEKSEDIEYDVTRVVQDFLTKHPGQTRDYIYDQVIKKLLTSVQIQKFDLDAILKNFFRKVGDEWYAPGTLVVRKSDATPQGELFQKTEPEKPEKEVVLALQDFLIKHGRVPYAELREFYLCKINLPIERNFDDLVKENFVVEEGKVRLPSPEQQRRMQNINVRYRIGKIRRLLESGAGEPLSITALCDAVEFCYQNEFYREGAQLFTLIHEDEVEPKRFSQIKKMAEVCRIKSG